ncbi:MAG: CDP-diacylglycerol--glycerol-3-phosphate 3-phosphatidyltransferase [bacterium]|nr:CDP-diacylglycerol--glycerol-3-phosphate 3-phosphatidyltransferase [bacterium]
MVAHLPNTLTMTRIAIIPLVVVCILLNTHVTNLIGTVLFAIASFTDFLDGYLARTWKATTRFGQFLDPVADKLLVASALFTLTGIERIDGLQVIPALVILCREILVSGLREFLAGAKVSIPVTQLAKWKTALQLFAIGALILHDSAPWGLPSHWIGVIGLWVAAALTLRTGWDYFQAGYKHIDADRG